VIERLYEVFAAPRPRVVDYCDHCVEPEDVAPFTTVPLRELMAEQVEAYYDATPRAFAALVEECTGENAPGELLAEWLRGRETR